MRRARPQAGFSLIEVVAGMGFFAIVAAGLAVTTVATVKANGASKDIAAASALVHDKVEQFRALDPAANPADLTPGTRSDPRNPMNALGEAGGRFTRTWVVTANTPRPGIARVVVTVAWTGPNPGSVSGVTLVCRTSTCS